MPKIVHFGNYELISFIQTAADITIPSTSGYAGLYRSEIEISFKYSDLSFKLEDVWWAIEYLDDKLREYFNTKD